MATLWTDVVDPATLSGYVRASLAEYEAAKGTLAQFLPNRFTPGTVVRFRVGQNGLIPEARYREYDAEPEVGEAQKGKRVTIELPAVSQEIPVSEYQQLLEQQASDEAMLNEILNTGETLVRSIVDRVEKTRGVVLTTGKATVSQDNFYMDDDFGRDPAMSVTASTLWSTTSADALAYLQDLRDLYRDKTGDEPGVILTSSRVIRAFTTLDQLATTLVGGATRPAREVEAQDTLLGAGLPPMLRFDRRTFSGKVLPDDRIFLLPAPVATDDWQGTQLGATVWGRTLTALDPAYGLVDAEMPGLVAGVYRNAKPPMIAQVVGDSINLPYLANANLSLVAKVL